VTPYRRTLAATDLFAAIAVFAAMTVIGDDALELTWLAALPMVVLVSKVAGLYVRDEPLVQKTTLDEVPRLFEVTTLYTLLLWLLGDTFARSPRTDTGEALFGFGRPRSS
jgi:uncharacterized membrane protein